MNRIEKGAAAELHELIENGVLKGRKIFFMGNIVNVYKFMQELETECYSVCGMVDNDTKKAGRYDIEGYEFEIHDPMDFFAFSKEEIALIIYSERFWCEMREQMIREGYQEGINLFILEGVSEQKKIAYIKKAWDILEEYKQKYGEDVFCYLFYGPIGDNYLFAGYIEEYNRKHGITNFVCIGTGATRKICEIYGFGQIDTLDRESIVAIEYLYMFLGDSLKNVHILPIWDWAFHFNRDCMRLNPRFSFMDTYIYYTYGLDDKSVLNPPKFDYDLEMVASVFSDKHLIPKKTVVLSPFAYSIPFQPPESFWKRLGKGLLDNGYSLAINVDPSPMHEKDEQNFIEGAQTVSFLLKEGMDFLKMAGYFIGMRSGLCDVLWNAECKKIILYPAVREIDYERHRCDMQFGSLEIMYGARDVREIEFDIKRKEDTLYWNNVADDILKGVLG
ncbi:hypothetical protein [Butyrivibrio sp. AE3004]|uniref:hypothetical protein n=1 Tax=Butyrivibrio sp. AE3004 TaxID=1506994 RepID=UPI000493D6AE|nr:hypothetical protein [Butyrivibrio sp. AE3004]